MFLLARVASLCSVKCSEVGPNLKFKTVKQCGQTRGNEKQCWGRARVNTRSTSGIYLYNINKQAGKLMNERHKCGVSATLSLLLAMGVTTLPLAAKSSPRSDMNAATTESTYNATTTAADRSTDTTQDTTTTRTRRDVRQARHHNSNKNRGIIIGGTALTGMLVGASVAGPVGALAGAGVGAGVGMVLAHIF